MLSRGRNLGEEDRICSFFQTVTISNCQTNCSRPTANHLHCSERLHITQDIKLKKGLKTVFVTAHSGFSWNCHPKFCFLWHCAVLFQYRKSCPEPARQSCACPCGGKGRERKILHIPPEPPATQGQPGGSKWHQMGWSTEKHVSADSYLLPPCRLSHPPLSSHTCTATKVGLHYMDFFFLELLLAL